MLAVSLDAFDALFQFIGRHPASMFTQRSLAHGEKEHRIGKELEAVFLTFLTDSEGKLNMDVDVLTEVVINPRAIVSEFAASPDNARSGTSTSRRSNGKRRRRLPSARGLLLSQNFLVAA